MTGAALFYMVSSTLAIAAFFLLIELVERGQDAAANVLAVTMEAYGDDEEEEDEEGSRHGSACHARHSRHMFRICAILLIGLPPFSGFLAKFLILTAVFNGDGSAPSSPRRSARQAGCWFHLSCFPAFRR